MAFHPDAVTFRSQSAEIEKGIEPKESLGGFASIFSMLPSISTEA
jgi:hypothetical protein